MLRNQKHSKSTTPIRHTAERQDKRTSDKRVVLGAQPFKQPNPLIDVFSGRLKLLPSSFIVCRLSFVVNRQPLGGERRHRWDVPRAGTATQPDPCPLLSFPLLAASFPPLDPFLRVGRLGVRTARARMVVKTMRQTTSCVGVAVERVYRDDDDERGHDTDTDTTWVERAIVASIRRDSISSTFGPIPG